MSRRPIGRHAAPRGGRHLAPRARTRLGHRAVVAAVLGLGTGAVAAGLPPADAPAATELPAASPAPASTRPAAPVAGAGAGMRVERAVRVSRDAPRVRPAPPPPPSWVLPLPAGSYRLSAGFGECGPLWSSCHTGMDLSAPTGTPVLAASGGVVREAASAGAYGNRLVLVLDDGTELWFCHLTSFSVAAGERVAAGRQIGTVGSTGNSTGPHLHLEVRPGGGEPVDPRATLARHGVSP